MPDQNKSEKEIVAEMVIRGLCPHHDEFNKVIDDKIELIKDQAMGMWNLVESKWHTIISDSQEVILEHISDLKGMVTSFMKRNSDDIVRLNSEVRDLSKRMASMEAQIFNFLKK